MYGLASKSVAHRNRLAKLYANFSVMSSLQEDDGFLTNLDPITLITGALTMIIRIIIVIIVFIVLVAINL